MSGGSLAGLLHLLALCGSWLVLIRAVSAAYSITVARFDHTDWWHDRCRFLVEQRSRRRL